ncbi:MAG: helix-turn-helix domain-containing protein [Candidatus Sulfotelmatobacter sp.]
MTRLAQYAKARQDAIICDPMLSLREVAAATGFNVSTIRRLMDKGALPYFQVGRGWIKIWKSSLDKFISHYESKVAHG